MSFIELNSPCIKRFVTEYRGLDTDANSKEFLVSAIKIVLTYMRQPQSALREKTDKVSEDLFLLYKTGLWRIPDGQA